MTGNLRPVRFLLVEDDDDHADLILRAMMESRIVNVVERISDGESAIKYLQRAAPYEYAERPDVVLLDLNLPKLNGHELLAWIKQNPSFRNVPVVVLTTSAAEVDVARAYTSQANSYLVKPLDFEQFDRMVRSLQLYWAVWNTPSRA